MDLKDQRLVAVLQILTSLADYFLNIRLLQEQHIDIYIVSPT